MSRVRSIFLMGGAGLLLIVLGLWLFRLPIAAQVLTIWTKDYRSTFIKNNPETALEKHWSEIVDDAEFLAQFDLFANGSGGNRDAGLFLNSLVGWESGATGRLSLSPEIIQLLEGKDFTTLKPNWKKLNLDFSWFKELQRFDHWNYDRHPPMYGNQETYPLHQAPLPDYRNFNYWTKLRLLKGRDDGDLLTAIKDVRHLARLVMSNENLVSSMVAVSFLSLERAIANPTDGKKPDFGGWRTFTQGEIKRARRFLWAQAAFTDLRLSEEVFVRAVGVPVGLCQRVHEGMYNRLGLRTISRHAYQAAFDRIDRLVQSTEGRCRDSFVRRMWKNPAYAGIFSPGQDIFATSSVLLSADEAPRVPGILRTTIEDVEKVPALAAALFHILAGLAEPNLFKLYEEVAVE